MKTPSKIELLVAEMFSGKSMSCAFEIEKLICKELALCGIGKINESVHMDVFYYEYKKEDEIKKVVPSVKITTASEVPNRLKVIDGRLVDKESGCSPIFGPEWNGIESVLIPSAHLKSFIDYTKERNGSPEFEGTKIEAYNWMKISDRLFVALCESVRKKSNGETSSERDAIDDYFDAVNQTALDRTIRKPL